MLLRKKWLLFIVLFISLAGFAQQPDTLIKKLDSLNKKADSTGGQNNNTNKANYNEATKITPSSYFILLGSNLKQEVTGPFHSSKKTWAKVGFFALAEGALFFADRPVQRYALTVRNSSRPIRNVSYYVTNFGGLYEAYVLGAFGAYGFIFKNEKMKTTTLLASQAYIAGGAMESVIKFLSGRQRPNVYNPDQLNPSRRFYGPFRSLGKDIYGNTTNSSFPSGHTTVAFAAATVYAMEYSHRPWIPIFAYSAATLIGVSRISENKHWATDVLAGAALGYVTGRQVVNNYHRYAKLKSPKQNKGSLSFNLQYQFGQLMPGMIYTFK